MTLFDGITERPILLIVILVAVFGVIVLAVILIRKYSPHFKNTETLKSEKEIAEEEVNRLIVDIEEEPTKDKDAPSEEEALAYEMNQILRESDDENYQKQAEEYAKEHPEEGEK